ncbi:restriction endonuclease subunit S [Phascolarctobacterium faecium]
MKEIRLKKITNKIGSGATPTGGKSAYKEEGISLIRRLNVYDYSFSYENLAYIDEVQAKKLSNVEIHENDILLNITGASVGRCCKVPRQIIPARVNQHVSIGRVDNNCANVDYILYYINSQHNKLRFLNIAQGGSTREALTKEAIENFIVELPDNNAQDFIANILSSYDNLIENNNRRIAILEEMAQRLYREWFVHFRFPGHENVKMVESKLGLIPENWHNFKIENIVSFNRGKSYRSSEINVEDGVPFINLKNIRAYGGFNKGGTKLFDGIYKESHKVRPGDIVMAVTDMTQERRLVGQVARVPNMKSDYAIISMDLIKLIPFQAQNSVYVYSLLRYSNLSRKIAGFANGANVLHLDPELVLQQDFIMPDDDTIKRFTSLVESLYNSVDICEEKNETLRKTRDHLLPRLISGDIDVSKLCVKIIKE